MSPVLRSRRARARGIWCRASRQLDPPTTAALRNEVARARRTIHPILARRQGAEGERITTRPPDEARVVHAIRALLDEQELRLGRNREAGGCRRERSQLDPPATARRMGKVLREGEDPDRLAGPGGAGRIRDEESHAVRLPRQRRPGNSDSEQQCTTSAQPRHACSTRDRLWRSAARSARSSRSSRNPRAPRTRRSADRRPSPRGSTR